MVQKTDMTPPEVDVIIPAYNAEQFLAEALNSVISQTYDRWRIVLVNDGSTDRTAEIAAEYQARIGSDRMLIISQKNKGLPAARNAAIRASNAEFIAILDADDVWLPCRLQVSLDVLRSRPAAGLSYGLVTRIDQNNQPLFSFEGNRHAEGRLTPFIFMRKVEFPCPTVTFRRQCVEEVGLFDESMRATEDRDLWLRISFRYEIAFVPKIIAYYRTYASSMSGDLDRMLAAQLKFIRKHYGAPGCGFVPRQVAISRAYKQRAEALAGRNQSGQAVLNALRACFIWPFGQDNLRTAASILLKSVGVL